MGTDLSRDLKNHLDLLVATKACSLYQDNARVKLALPHQLFEVADVQRDEDAILFIGAIEKLGISRSFKTAIADVPRVDTRLDQCPYGSWR